MRDERTYEQERRAEPDREAPSEVQALQRQLGNRALVQLRRALQRRSAPQWMRDELGPSAERAGDEVQVPSGGQPLPPAIQRQAEAQLGTSLAAVTIAQGADAACDGLGALAFATPDERGGHTVALSSAVDLASDEGRFTLLHELAHVAQQQRGATAALAGLGGDEGTRAQLEADADAFAARCAGGTAP
jgi:hypothetical protein